MTISSTTQKNSHSANGSTHSFAYGFKIFADGDLEVIVRTAAGVETTKTLDTHYVVTNAGNSSGGNVLFKYNTGTSSDAHYSTTDYRPANGETVVIRRNLALTQGTDYVENDPFPAASHEDALDRLTFIAQQIQEGVDRSIKITKGNTLTSTEFATSATDRASKVLGFDSSGNLAITSEVGNFKGNWATSTAYVLRDIVIQNSTSDATTYKNVYICTTAHTSSGSYLTASDTSNWAVLVEVAAFDTISELGDTTISSPSGGHLLIYDGSDSWDNKAMSGDATIATTGAITIAADAVESGMLNDNIISGQTALTSGLASTDELILSDAGALKRIDVSVLTDYYKDLTVTETNKTLTSPVLNTGVSGTAVKDEDDMTSDSATHLATQQSIKAYVDAQKADMQFVLEDGDGTEVQITKDKEVKFVEGGGIDINWTDTDNGTDGDPFDLTFTINAAQTDITSLLATDIKIGEDDQTKIDFETANQINFYADNTKRVTIDSTGLTVNSGSIETATIDYTDGDLAMTIADGGAVTFAQVPVFPNDTIETADIQDNAVTLAKMAGLARGKLIYGDSSGDPAALAIGTNGQYLKSDGNDLVWGSATVSGLACDDLTVGDGAVTISTSSGDITIDAQGNDTDIIFKGTDGSADTTFLTIDGSDAGKLLPNNGIDLNAKELILDADADTSITADTDDQIDFKAGNVIRASVISTGLQIGGTAYFASPTLTLKDPDSGVGAGTIGGKIDFHTMDGTGTGVSAKIQAKYEDANGNTSVSFETGSGGSTSEKMNIASGGNVTISDGDLVIGTSGHGIDFSATSTSAQGSMTSELLTVYEQGTFSPAAEDYSGTLTFTTAYYTKIGRIVNFAFKMTGDGTSDSSQIAISGFPYAVLAEHPVSLSFNTGATVGELPNAMVNTAEICYFYVPSGSGFTYTMLGSGYVRVAGTYMTTN